MRIDLEEQTKSSAVHFLRGVTARALCFSFLSLLFPLLVFGQAERPENAFARQKHYAELLKAGDTNCPLFELDWFDKFGSHSCRISQTGEAFAQNKIAFDSTNLNLLLETIDQLPPTKPGLPKEALIIIGCRRSNEWFLATYDRRDIPEVVERIAEITGINLPWIIPTVSGRSVGRIDNGKFLGVAIESPVAFSARGYDLQVWNLRKTFHSYSGPIETPVNLFDSSGYNMAITPNGNIIAFADYQGLFALDWRNHKILWKSGPLDRDNYTGKHVVVADNGHSLYTAGSHIIERWNLTTGAKLTVLETNQENVNFLKVSQNGKVLLAGFGLKYNWRPWSFAVWESGKSEPSFRFSEPETQGALADLSPDGEQIALSKFGADNLILLNWRTHQKKQIRLRNAREIYSVYWSPDGKRLAAYTEGANDYFPSIYIYDTATWKPITHWECGRYGHRSDFLFQNNGILLQICENEINALDVTALKR